MKLFALLALLVSVQLAQSTFYFPSPDLTNAIDAIERPKYRQALQNMFPHLSYNSRKQKIINGGVANLGDFPYQVLLYMTYNNVEWYTCGGSLINRQWVLTAGHCVFEFTRFELYFGLIERPPGPYAWSTTATGSADVHLHSSYNDDTLANDIALIFLAQAPPNLLDLNHIGAIALPRASDAQVDLTGRTGSVSGFGRTSDAGSPSNVLMNTTAPIMSNAQCALVFGPYILGSNVCLDTSGGAGSSCRGDSGGPLTAELEPGRRAIVGVVSFGAASGCALGYPDVYTRVTSFLDWIENIIDPREPGDGTCNCVCICHTCPEM